MDSDREQVIEQDLEFEQIFESDKVELERDEKQRVYDKADVLRNINTMENYAQNQVKVENEWTSLQKRDLLSDVKNYVREDSPADRLSNKKLKSRERAMSRKQAIRKEALDADNNLNGFLDKKEKPALQDAELHGYKYVNMGEKVTLVKDEDSNVTDEARDEWIRKQLNLLDASDIICTEYDNDTQFVELYPSWRAQLAGAYRLEALLRDEYLKKYVGEAAVPKVKEELQAKLKRYRKLDQYIELKMKLIKNPYYMMLREKDLGRLTAEELGEKSTFFGELGRKTLQEYTMILAELKGLEKQGITRKSLDPDALYSRRNVVVSRDSMGNRTVTIKSADVMSVDTKKVWYGKTGYMDGEHSNPVFSKKRDMNYEMLKYDPTISEIETTDYSKKSQVLDGIGIGKAATGEVNIFRGRIMKKKDVDGTTATGNASAHVGKVAVRGSIGCGLTTKGHFAPGINAAIGIEGTVAEGNIAGNVEKKAGPLTMAGAFANATGKFITADASLMGRVGKFNRVKANPNQNDPEGPDIGLSLGLDAKAYLVHGKAEGGFKLLGVSFKGNVQGGIGAEASAALVVTTGKIMFGLGAALGLGGSLNVEIDYSELTNVVAGVLKKTGSSIAGLIKRKLSDRGAHKDSKVGDFMKLEKDALTAAVNSKAIWQKTLRERKEAAMEAKTAAAKAAKAKEKQKIKKENEKMDIPPQMANLWTRSGMLHA